MKFNFVIKIRAPHFKSVQQKCERGRKCADVGATGTAANSIPALAVLWPRLMVDQQLYLNERTRTRIGGKWKNSALTCWCMCAHVSVHIGTSGFRPIPTPALLPPFSCFPFPLRSFTSVLLGSTFFRRVENSFFAGLWKVFSLSLSRQDAITRPRWGNGRHRGEEEAEGTSGLRPSKYTFASSCFFFLLGDGIAVFLRAWKMGTDIVISKFLFC